MPRFNSVFSAAVAVGLVLVAPLGAQAPRIITKPVLETDLVTLKGNTPPPIKGGTDLGAIPDSTPFKDLWLVLKRPAEVEKAWTEFLDSQQNKSSPNYHKWITPQDAGTQYGVNQQDIDTVSQWLQSHGLTVSAVPPYRNLIVFAGTAGQLREAFHSEIHSFDVAGKRHYSNVSDPQIPAALEPIVVGPTGLNDFGPHPVLSTKLAASMDPTRTTEPLGPVRAMDPTRTTEPLGPVRAMDPARTTEPVGPVRAMDPTRTTEPLGPVRTMDPARTTEPVGPVRTMDPARTTEPVGPVRTMDPARTTEPVGPVRASEQSGAVPAFNAGGTNYTVVPGDMYTIYNFNPILNGGYSGQGVIIVALEDGDIYTSSDFGIFRKEFGIARPYLSGNLSEIHPSGAYGTCNDPGVVAGVEAEAILDAEWSSAAAPSATVILASCADVGSEFGGFLAISNMLTNGIGPIPQIVSISYGNGEKIIGGAQNNYINGLYQSLASYGVSVFVAAGDEGAAGDDANPQPCGVSNCPVATGGIVANGLASTPYDVAVGGTDFGDAANNIPPSLYWSNTNGTYFNSALSYIQEIPWNNSCASQLLATSQNFTQTYGASGFCNENNPSKYINKSAGSGAPSQVYTKPYWQTGFVGNPADGWRDVPDVSVLAASGIWGHTYVICYSDTVNGGSFCDGAPNTWATSGGTSVGTPVWAGIFALVISKLGIVTGQGAAGVGNPLSTIYSLAGNTYGGAAISQCNSNNGGSVFVGCLFYDITQGDNNVPCYSNTTDCYNPGNLAIGVLSTSTTSYQPAFVATPGWDFASGIGSVNVANFVNVY